jgi:hypothetical protein
VQNRNQCEENSGMEGICMRLIHFEVLQLLTSKSESARSPDHWYSTVQYTSTQAGHCPQLSDARKTPRNMIARYNTEFLKWF